MVFIYFFQGFDPGTLHLAEIKRYFDRYYPSTNLRAIETEYCYAIECTSIPNNINVLKWLITETWLPDSLKETSMLKCEKYDILVEIGPRLGFATAWSTNATLICQACNVGEVVRIERSKRYFFRFCDEFKIDSNWDSFLSKIHDRMTEMQYLAPFGQMLDSLSDRGSLTHFYTIPIVQNGRSALEFANKDLNLGFDQWDLSYYTDLFLSLGRDPTNVELFDISQSNSEHSRHWFFKGKIVVDGVERKKSLMHLVMEPHRAHKTNSVIAFNDNSSSIQGFKCKALVPQSPGGPSILHIQNIEYDITFTAETHNFPTGIAPFPGAETGIGGRIRDGHAAGKGSLILIGIAGYSVGQLLIPNYKLPWESEEFSYPSSLATPLQILIEASNGASDYGNKFGEPIVLGFIRSFGLMIGSERREYIKPIMFTGGQGYMNTLHRYKEQPNLGMLVIRVGGGAYRIGLGGGAASSLIQGVNESELDFNAVQRGDAEMEQKLNRVIRACIELGDRNPIVSIHDQGAGGPANAIKELVYPAGANIDIQKFTLGDKTMTALEIWCAEYQESDVLLLRPENIHIFKNICKRESCIFDVIGHVTGDGRVVLTDRDEIPVDFPLDKILCSMPQKSFYSSSYRPLQSELPSGYPLEDLSTTFTQRVLKNVGVGSKRFLTTKVDRCITGLVVQQQCLGPMHVPVSDCAITSTSYFEPSGAVTSVGEQPIKGLIDPMAMARITVGEALTNIVGAFVTGGLENIKASGNWMWPAKLDGEADAIYKACEALSEFLMEVGVSIDGGKDSLTMATLVRGEEKVVKAPGTLVISLYGPMENTALHVNPVIKEHGSSYLILVDMGCKRMRMGGSAWAHGHGTLGDVSPDVDNIKMFVKTWNVIQRLVRDRLILACHDRSDGGLITTVLEMCIAGQIGVHLQIPREYVASGPDEFHIGAQEDHGEDLLNEKWWLDSVIRPLFNEELGVVLEVSQLNLYRVLSEFECIANAFCIGQTTDEKKFHIEIQDRTVIHQDLAVLWQAWEATSFELERLQANPKCVEQEKHSLWKRQIPQWRLTYDPDSDGSDGYKIYNQIYRPSMAVIREEGSNGDREMCAVFASVGFEVWDVTMSDLIEEKINLNRFKGVAFSSGFTYADVLGSAKGWAGEIIFNSKLNEQFKNFFHIRKDTFSLGVCNGCQLMTLLGYLPFENLDSVKRPRFMTNESERHESRFLSVTILNGPSIMLKGMHGSTLGVWISHKEGRLFFPDDGVLQAVLRGNLAQIRYVDDDGNITQEYPHNPNGSAEAIAGLCSEDGRHLCLMPHCDRTFLFKQWPWIPKEWERYSTSPWLKMFQNAYDWLLSQSK